MRRRASLARPLSDDAEADAALRRLVAGGVDGCGGQVVAADLQLLGRLGAVGARPARDGHGPGADEAGALPGLAVLPARLLALAGLALAPRLAAGEGERHA